MEICFHVSDVLVPKQISVDVLFFCIYFYDEDGALGARRCGLCDTALAKTKADISVAHRPIQPSLPPGAPWKQQFPPGRVSEGLELPSLWLH